MKKSFGQLPDGSAASLYTITNASLTAKVTDVGATLVSLLVPDKKGNIADVVLGYDDAAGICLETQYYPDSVNHPEWPQSVTRAGERYHSETVYKFN